MRDLETINAAIAASRENQYDDHERGIPVPKPETESLRAERAVELVEAKRYAEALVDLNWILNREPKDAEALLNRGHAYRFMERWAEAEEDFLKAFELAPKYTGARDRWVEMRRNQGKPTE